MESNLRKSGLDVIGDVPWGMHYCYFYQTRKDLTDILVPYFKAGLENNEFCIWVTSEPLDAKEAKKAIRKAVPDFGLYLERGQIEILPYDSWYLKDSVLDLSRVLNNWIDKINQALSRGYDGMRVSGNTSWLEKSNWRSFTEYEEELNRVIGGYRMIALCTYSLGLCGAPEIIDVVSNHQFALIKRNSKWVVIESAEQLRVEDELKESVGKHRTLVNNVNLGIFRSTPEPDGKFLEVNPAMERITGYSRKELLQMSVSGLYRHPGERERILEEIASDADVTTRELCFIKKDGTEIIVSDTKTAVRNDAGQIMYFDGILQDITERKHVEDLLRESEEKFRKFFEDSPIGIAISGHDKRFLNVNSRFCDMLGYTPEEIIGATFADITHPDYVEKNKGNIEKISRGEMAVYRTEKRYIKKNKEPLWAFTTVSGVYNVENTIKYYLAMVDDITERKQAEEALKISLEQYHDLYEEAPNAYFSVGTDGCIKMANHRATELLGYSMDELIGKPVIDLYAATPAGKAKARDIFQQFTNAREVRAEELQMLTADGRELWINLSVKPIVDENGRVVQSRSVVVDITERVKMREQLIMQDRLASIGQLVSGIAHELNNPLTGVIGFSDMLLKRDLPADVKEDLETINNEAQRTANVVKGLLTFARKQKIEKESVDINSIIQGVLQLRSYEQKVSNIEVNTRFAHDLPQIFGNGAQLQQVILNIITNAEQAMLETHERGRLTITTEQVGNMVRVSFTDDGPGIAKENLGHLFDPFFTTREVGKGTGLGLSISHGIVSAHGGKIYAESQLGKGATFVVELPITASSKEKEEYHEPS